MDYKHIIINSKCLLQQDKIDEQALEMVCHLLVARCKPIILINDSFANIEHTKILLKKINFFNEQDMYSTTMQIEAQTFLQVCKSQNIEPNECVFIDGTIENLDVAAKLKMATIKFESVKNCMQALVDKNIIVPQTLYYDYSYLESLELEKTRTVNCMYPSLVGLYENSAVIKWDTEKAKAIPTDDCDENGNLRKRCLYESLLAKLVCEDARAFWQKAYAKINELFLMDFSIKSVKASKSLNKEEAEKSYTKYFSHIETILKKLTIINKDKNHNADELYAGLKKLFAIDFDLTTNFDLTSVSQFYYDVWLHDYGPKPLEPFVFLANEIKSKQNETLSISSLSSISSLYTKEKNLNTTHKGTKISLLKDAVDVTNKYESRMLAYCKAQLWIYCGTPQLRGRIKKENSQASNTMGILRDNDDYAEKLKLHTDKHFAAKNAFSPMFEHTISKDLKKLGCPIIGGPSGTLGRNIYMLAPLIENGLLTYNEVLEYIMVFCADLVKRGHHSYGECGITESQIVTDNFMPWLDAIRNPVKFYEQFLTEDFKNSTIYKNFVVEHQDFFNEEIKNVNKNKYSF